jgi:hypothetical protein
MDRTEQSQPAALEELATDPSSRKRFLRMAGGGAVASALSVAIAACGEDEEAGDTFGGAGVSTKQFGAGDTGIVGYALFLEQLEVAFYEAVVASKKLSGRAGELAIRFLDTERAHVETLSGTYKSLGGKESPAQKFTFPLGAPEEILGTAAQVESLGAGAYLGQMDRIQSKQVLAAALSIQAVEARHAAALALLTGQAIAPPSGFASPATSVDVLRQIRPFIAQ